MRCICYILSYEMRQLASKVSQKYLVRVGKFEMFLFQLSQILNMPSDSNILLQCKRPIVLEWSKCDLVMKIQMH